MGREHRSEQTREVCHRAPCWAEQIPGSSGSQDPAAPRPCALPTAPQRLRAEMSRTWVKGGKPGRRAWTSPTHQGCGAAWRQRRELLTRPQAGRCEAPGPRPRAGTLAQPLAGSTKPLQEQELFFRSCAGDVLGSFQRKKIPLPPLSPPDGSHGPTASPCPPQALSGQGRTRTSALIHSAPFCPSPRRFFSKPRSCL